VWVVLNEVVFSFLLHGGVLGVSDGMASTHFDVQYGTLEGHFLFLT